MNKYINDHRIMVKTVAAAIVCLFSFSALSVADMDTTTLSPELLFSNAKSGAELQAVVICELIEKRAREWEGKTIEQIYTDDMLLWKRSTEPVFEGVDPVLSVDRTEINILIPESRINIRYYDSDPGINKTLTPFANWLKTETHVITSRINRQILHLTDIVGAESAYKGREGYVEEQKPERSEITVQKLTKEYAAQHIGTFIKMQQDIHGDVWAPEQFLSDAWKDGEWGRSGDRVFHAKWEHSLVAIDANGKIAGFVLAYERAADEELEKVGKRSLYIHQFAVSSESRGQGLGKMLVHQLADDLLKSNFLAIEQDEDPIITLKFDQHVSYLRKVYQSMGFEEIDRTVTRFENEDDHEDYIYAGRALDVLDRTAPVSFVEEAGKYEDLIKKCVPLISTISVDNGNDLLLRVPVEVIESMDQEDVRNFFDAFQHKNGNGYIELFYASGTGAVNEKAYRMYGLRSKPAGFEFNKENTITLMPAMRGEISADPRQAKKDIEHLIVTRTGNLKSGQTQIVPIGYQNDTLGILRGTLFGLVMVHIAREKSKGNKPDEDIMSNQFMRSILSFYTPQEIESVGLTDRDLVDLATGGINQLIPVLRKLIDLLPIEPVDAKQIYENTRKVWVAA